MKLPRVKLVVVGVFTFVMLCVFFLDMEDANADVSDPVNHSQNNGEAKTMFGFLAAVAFYATEKGHDVDPFLSLGKTFANSDVTVGEIGVRINGKWEYNVGLLGEGYTKNGHQKSTYYGGITRIIDPDVHFLGGRILTGIGVQYTPNFLLVGESNFKLVLMWVKGRQELKIVHISSGGMWDENAGHDAVMYTLRVGAHGRQKHRYDFDNRDAAGTVCKPTLRLDDCGRESLVAGNGRRL